MRAGWSYINLSELVKDKKKRTQTHAGVGLADFLALK